MLFRAPPEISGRQTRIFDRMDTEWKERGVTFVECVTTSENKVTTDLWAAFILARFYFKKKAIKQQTVPDGREKKNRNEIIKPNGVE